MQPENPPSYRHDTVLPLPQEVRSDALAVDAACSGNPGVMEYRGVDLRTGEEVFHSPKMWGTNNIGEFLAIVHALALIERDNLPYRVVYSDSLSARAWVRNKKAKTTLPLDTRTREALVLVRRGEIWLLQHTRHTEVMMWDTRQWGEIPADFGRKK